MTAATLMAVLTLAAADGGSQAPFEVRRSGALGWGLGLELPMVGVMTGVGGASRPGWGWSLGSALSVEIVPTVLARLTVSGGETSNGRAPVTWLDVNDDRVQKAQRADWLGIAIGLGGAYLWRQYGRAWAPFAGGDVAVSFDGYDYHLDDELETLKAQDAVDLLEGCIGEECASDIHDGLTIGWSATVRGGMRLEILSWLATQAELSVTYAPIAKERVSNTLTAPDVSSKSESLFLIRGTFSVRLGV